MRIWLRRGVFLVAAGVLLWLVLALGGLLPRISAEQAAALADMRAAPQQAVGQRNALELIWSLRFEVPPEQRAEVLREDAAALDAWRPEHGAAPNSVAAERYPLREATAAPSLPGCDLDCLQQVRDQPEAWRAALAARTSRLQSLEALGEYDHLRMPFRLSLSMPAPAFLHTGDLQIAAAALRFVDGDATAALDSLCRNSADWRALKGRSDTLISEMILLAWLRRAAQLYADLRAELPADFPLPPSCTAAFAPLPVEQRMACDVFRSEFRMLDNTLAQELHGFGDPEHSWRDRAMAVALNREATVALMAPHYRDACKRLRQPVRAWQDWPVEPGCPWQHRVFNPVGCIIYDMAMPNYLDYLRRERDLEGQLRLLQLADRLVGQADPAAAFKARPEELAEFEQPVRFDGDELLLDLLQPRPNQPPTLRVPLPASRLPAAAAAANGVKASPGR
jgi:hypothetical protein